MVKRTSGSRKPLTRSENMARIRSRDTKPEIRLRKALWAAGCRYRLYYDLPGRPDIVFIRERLAVFVDGCFWHGCPLHYSAPRTREDFWKSKLRKNVLRDMAADDALASENWRVIRIWQHDLVRPEPAVRHILDLLARTEAIYAAADLPSVTKISESAAVYGTTGRSESDIKTELTCKCGSSDVRILEVNGYGSLRSGAGHRPESVELICRTCRNIWSAVADSDETPL